MGFHCFDFQRSIVERARVNDENSHFFPHHYLGKHSGIRLCKKPSVAADRLRKEPVRRGTRRRGLPILSMSSSGVENSHFLLNSFSPESERTPAAARFVGRICLETC